MAEPAVYGIYGKLFPVSALGNGLPRAVYYGYFNFSFALNVSGGCYRAYFAVVWAEIPYISRHMPEANENAVSQMKELIYQQYNFTVKGYKSLVVHSRFAALVSCVGGKVEHIPYVSTPKVGVPFKTPQHIFVVFCQTS